MSNKITSLQCNHNKWEINGELSYGAIRKLELQAIKERARINSTDTWIIDVTNVPHIDSAGLAWLIINKKWANEHNLQLNIEGFKSQEGYNLAKVQGVSQLLEIEKTHIGS
jgi:ABC-type transporter Mla MlaB component